MSAREPASFPPGDEFPTQFRRWRFWRRWFGERSECAAAKYLRGKGYRILATNVADRRGELDLIARYGNTLVVVEVRSTSTMDPQRAADSVDFRKQRKLTEAALRFLSRRRLLNVTVRFDVLAIAWPLEQQEPMVMHIPNAFEATGKFQMFG